MAYLLHSAPMIRVLVPFTAGVAAGLSFSPHVDIAYTSGAISMGLAAYLVFQWDKWKLVRLNPTFGLLAAVAFFFIGLSWSTLRSYHRQYEQHFTGTETSFAGQVLAYPLKKTNSVALELQVHTALDSSGIYQGKFVKILAYLAPGLRADTLRPGDGVLFKSVPQPHQRPLNPHQFDFGNYLVGQGFAATVYIKDDVQFSRSEDKPFVFRAFFETWRYNAIALFDGRQVEERELGVISALVLGKRDTVDPNIRRAFSDAGTVHILAVSGLHVGIIYFLVAAILSRLLAGPKLRFARLLVCLLVLWLYAGLTGFSPSVLRAATMFSFIALGKEFNRFGSIYNMLAASAFFLLIFDPFLLFAVGFQLSYLAVLGIVIIHPMLYPKFAARWWWLDKVWSLLVVSLAAQIATFPLTVHYFNQFPNYFLISNLLVIPLATLLLYAGIASMLCAWIPYLSDVCFLITSWIAKVLNELVLLFGHLPTPVSKGLYITMWEALLLYLMAVALYIAFQDPRRGRLRFAQLTLLLLAGLYGFRKIEGALSTDVVCFHIDGGTVISAVQGRTAHLYISNDFTPDSAKIEYALRSYFQARGVTDTKAISMPRSFTLNGKSITLVKDVAELYRAQSAQPDYIVFQGKWYVDDSFPKIDIPGTKMIIDGSVPYYHRAQLQKHIAHSNNMIWNTSVIGAIDL